MGSGDPSLGPRASIAGILPTELSPQLLMPVSYLLCVLTGCGCLENSPPHPYLPGDYTSLSRYELGLPLSRDPLAPLLVPHNPIRTRTGSLGRSNPTGPSVHLLWTQGHVSAYASDHLPMKFSAGRAHPEGTDRNGFDLSWTPFPSTMFGTQKLLSIVDQWINRGLVQSDQCRTFHKCRMGT